MIVTLNYEVNKVKIKSYWLLKFFTGLNALKNTDCKKTLEYFKETSRNKIVFEYEQHTIL